MAGKYDLAKTKLGDILKDPEAEVIFDEVVPDLRKHPMIKMAMGMPVLQIIKLSGGQLSDEQITSLQERLNAL
ncbi:hypothetical protein ASD56_02585 [Microbacterium sp. Root166]|uniref:hypothetical protein n=1 Tax=Microbacterium sp. Root166 TaxID=1736478 RepID=UPI0006F548C6|nr:hypothetical protein [Microbacterium sp. Root166]KQZ85267.1 hypothetical protein ASD56_02585 [Microbacterium sp. Root166]